MVRVRAVGNAYFQDSPQKGFLYNGFSSEQQLHNSNNFDEYDINYKC